MDVVRHFMIDGQREDLLTFVLPEMSLSSARSKMTAHEFIIGFNITPLADLLDADYEGLRAELKEDDALIGETGSPLAVAGYPHLEHALCVPELAQEILNLLLTKALQDRSWNGVGCRRYWFDRSVRCRVNCDVIDFIGVCYSER